MNILRAISGSYRIITPASLRMFAKVACGFGVSSIEVATNFSAICFTLAVRSSTVKYVNSAAINVFNGRCWLEKDING